MRRFLRCERGTPEIEFAILAPVVIMALVGIVEMGSAIKAKRHMEQATSQAAVLAAKITSIVATPKRTPTVAEINTIRDAVRQDMDPADGSRLSLRITGVMLSTAGVPKVAWGRGDNPLPAGATVFLPAGAVPPLVYVESKYPWQSVLGLGSVFTTGSFQMTDKAVAAAR